MNNEKLEKEITIKVIELGIEEIKKRIQFEENKIKVLKKHLEKIKNGSEKVFPKLFKKLNEELKK